MKSVRLACGKFCGTSLRFPFVVAMDAYDAVEPVADINLEQEATVILGRRSENLAQSSLNRPLECERELLPAEFFSVISFGVWFRAP